MKISEMIRKGQRIAAQDYILVTEPWADEVRKQAKKLGIKFKEERSPIPMTIIFTPEDSADQSRLQQLDYNAQIAFRKQKGFTPLPGLKFKLVK